MVSIKDMENVGCSNFHSKKTEVKDTDKGYCLCRALSSFTLTFSQVIDEVD